MTDKERVALLEFGEGWSMWITAEQLPLTIGRGAENTVVLADNLGVSRRHCMLDFRENVLHVIDVGSTNGTEVEGRWLQGQSTGIGRRSCVVVGDVVFWVTPCDPLGRLVLVSDADDTTYHRKGFPTRPSG